MKPCGRPWDLENRMEMNFSNTKINKADCTRVTKMVIVMLIDNPVINYSWEAPEPLE